MAIPAERCLLTRHPTGLESLVRYCVFRRFLLNLLLEAISCTIRHLCEYFQRRSINDSEDGGRLVGGGQPLSLLTRLGQERA